MDNVGYSPGPDHDEERKIGTGSGEPEHEQVFDFKAKKWPQLFAALSANLGAFGFGSVVCWSATAVPKLKNDDDFSGILTDNSISWISSMVTLGAMFSCIPSGFAVDRIGRRKTMLLLAPPFLLGWLLIYFAPKENIAMILAGRFITGFTGGAFSVTCPLYIAETSESKIRGMLISGYDLMICNGMLFIFVVGTFIDWRDQALACAFVPVIFFILIFFTPETPRYFLAKGMEEEAKKSLCWLRGTLEPRMIKPEFIAIKDSIALELPSLKAKAGEFQRRSVQKAFLVCVLLFFFQVFSGMIVVLSYTVEIFDSAGSSMDPYHQSIIIGAIESVASVSSALVVDRFGRKILLLASQIVMGVSMAALGAFFNVQESDYSFAMDNLGWLPLVALTLFVVGYSIGIGPVPFSIMPEIMPQTIRGLAASLLTTLKWAMAFIMTQFFKDMMKGLGQDGGYWFFAAVSLLGAVYVIFVPETKGEVLEKNYFEDKDSNNKQTSKS